MAKKEIGEGLIIVKRGALIALGIGFSLLSFADDLQVASPMDLNSFLKSVDRNYPKLRSTRLEREIADAKAQEKRGAFDPIFSTETNFLRYNSTSTRGKESFTRMSETVLEVMDRSGVKLSAGQRLNMGSVKSPSSSTGALGEWFVSAKIPLIRDLGINPKSIGEKQALFGQPLADQMIREMRFEILGSAAQAYWEWVGAGEKLSISRNLLSIAEKRADFVRARFTAGAIPRIDTDEADAEVFRRQASFEKSERDLQKAELKISNYLWNPDTEPQGLPARSALPGFVPLAEEPKADEVALGRNRAKRIRPELSAIEISRDILKLDLALAKNDRRPALDLVIGPGYDLGDDGIGNTYKAGLLYSVPLVQNQAKGRIQQAQVKLRKLDFEQQQQLRQIEIEIDDAVSAVRQNYRRYRATLDELSANRRLEQGETDRFNLGIGTLFLINQRERQRAESETRLVEVRVELEQSLAAYLAATAQLNPQ